MKDIDSAARSRFIRVIVWVFPIVGFLGFFVGFMMYGKPGMGLLIGAVVGAAASCITYLIIEMLGSSGVNLLYGTRRPVWSEYEKYEGKHTIGGHRPCLIRSIRKHIHSAYHPIKKARGHPFYILHCISLFPLWWRQFFFERSGSLPT